MIRSRPFISPLAGTNLKPKTLLSDPRFEWTLKFIQCVQLRYPDFSWLDIGEPNTMAFLLSQEVKRHPEHTVGDLDTIRLSGKYMLITCLEVLEHLYNPLHLLEQIRDALLPEGICILTTPYSPWGFGRSHFHEMDDTRLRALVSRASLKIAVHRRIPRTRIRNLIRLSALKYIIARPYKHVMVLQNSNK